MDHLQLTPEGPQLEEERLMPTDEPMSEAVMRELELDRAADEGMIEPPGPEMDMPGIEPPGPEMDMPGQEVEVPGPEDEPRWPGVEVPGTEVPPPEDEPRDPVVERPGIGDRPPVASAGSRAAGFDRPGWRAA